MGSHRAGLLGSIVSFDANVITFGSYFATSAEVFSVHSFLVAFHSRWQRFEGSDSSGPVSITFSMGRSMQSVFLIKTVTVYGRPFRPFSYKVISIAFA